MRIGIPQEIKVGETRVAVTPQGVSELVCLGHDILVQRGAGSRSGWTDSQFRRAGAKLTPSLKEIYRYAELICKVKEPQAQEIPLLKEGQALFSFLHLAGNPRLLKDLQKRKVVAIAYELIKRDDGHLPLLAPMSEVAGRMATLIGANLLRSDFNGKGILLSRVGKVPCGTVGVIGCGHVGQAAISVAYGLRAKVYAVDKDTKKLRALKKRYGKRLQVFPSNRANIHKVVRASDLLIGAVLIVGKRAPQVVTTTMVRAMSPGSVIVDVAIDEGGCVATSRPTPIDRPVFEKYGVLHCAVPNFPALVPQTASQLLASAVFPYLKKLAQHGWQKAIQKDRALSRGAPIILGEIVG